MHEFWRKHVISRRNHCHWDDSGRQHFTASSSCQSAYVDYERMPFLLQLFLGNNLDVRNESIAGRNFRADLHVGRVVSH